MIPGWSDKVLKKIGKKVTGWSSDDPRMILGWSEKVETKVEKSHRMVPRWSRDDPWMVRQSRIKVEKSPGLLIDFLRTVRTLD